RDRLPERDEQRVEIGLQIVAARVSRIAILGQRPLEHGHETRGRLRPRDGEWLWIFRHHATDERHLAVAFPGTLPAEDLVEHDAEREDVGAAIQGIAAE